MDITQLDFEVVCAKLAAHFTKIDVESYTKRSILLLINDAVPGSSLSKLQVDGIFEILIDIEFLVQLETFPNRESLYKYNVKIK